LFAGLFGPTGFTDDELVLAIQECGQSLHTVLLNGCDTDRLCDRLRDKCGVDTVIGWRGKPSPVECIAVVRRHESQRATSLTATYALLMYPLLVSRTLSLPLHSD
jgi:hypothetical protein